MPNFRLFLTTAMLGGRQWKRMYVRMYMGIYFPHERRSQTNQNVVEQFRARYSQIRHQEVRVEGAPEAHHKRRGEGKARSTRLETPVSRIQKQKRPDRAFLFCRRNAG